MLGPRFDLQWDLHILDTEVDPRAERARLEREKSRLEQQTALARKQLDNEEFRRRAPQEVVKATEHRYAELAERHRKVVESLERLGSGGV